MSAFGSAIRPDFPGVVDDFVLLDAPGGTQMPSLVTDRMREVGRLPISNRNRFSVSGRNSDDAVQEFRAAAADLFAARPEGIVHGRSATQLTFDFARTMADGWKPGDNIVLTNLEHECNVTPWRVYAERAGVEVRWALVDVETGELPAAQFEGLVDGRTRLVAVTAASNLIGTMPDVRAIADIAHAAGAQLWVDGVHYVPHAAVDLAALGADYFVTSPYKYFGPHTGVLAARPEALEELHPDKLTFSYETVPERFELGTLPYEALPGTTAAVDYIASLAPASVGAGASRRERVVAAMHAMDEYELQLRSIVEQGIADIAGVTCYSRAARRTPTLLLGFEGISAPDAAERLRARGFVALASHFAAIELSKALGLGDEGGVRFGVAPYNTVDEMERLVEAVREVAAGR